MAPSMLAQATGDVRVSTSPRLTEGIAEGGLVLVKTCLDCPGLAHTLCCCGHNPDSQLPVYKVDIVYRVS